MRVGLSSEISKYFIVYGIFMVFLICVSIWLLFFNGIFSLLIIEWE